MIAAGRDHKLVVSSPVNPMNLDIRRKSQDFGMTRTIEFIPIRVSKRERATIENLFGLVDVIAGPKRASLGD